RSAATVRSKRKGAATGRWKRAAGLAGTEWTTPPDYSLARFAPGPRWTGCRAERLLRSGRSAELVDVLDGDVAIALELERQAGELHGEVGGRGIGVELSPALGLAEDGLARLAGVVDEVAGKDVGALPRHDAGVEDVALGQGHELATLAAVGLGAGDDLAHAKPELRAELGHLEGGVETLGAGIQGLP